MKHIKTLFLILGFICFFLIETFYYNEILLTVLLLIGVVIDQIVNRFSATKLGILGFILGLIIEGYMGTFSRTQYWENTFLFDIPMWLPLAWGYGFIIIYRIGKYLNNP